MDTRIYFYSGLIWLSGLGAGIYATLFTTGQLG